MLKKLDKIEMAISCSALILTVVFVVVNVFTRYFLGYTISWAEEISTVCFMISVFIGMSMAYRKKMHVGVDFVLALLPLKFKKYFKILTGLVMLFLNGTILYLTLEYIKTAKKVTPVLSLKYSHINIALVIGFFLIVIYTLEFMYQDIKSEEM